LVCNYAGLYGVAFSLTASRAVSSVDARRLARLAREIRRTDVCVVTCPADRNTAVVLGFALPAVAPWTCGTSTLVARR
jgi:hypothetical protein